MLRTLCFNLLHEPTATILLSAISSTLHIQYTKQLQIQSRTVHPVNKSLRAGGESFDIEAFDHIRTQIASTKFSICFCHIPSLWVGIFQGQAAIFSWFVWNIAHFKAALEKTLIIHKVRL